MPVEQAKEVAKVAIETSGSFSAIWQWAVGGLGGGFALLWGHVTGRLKKLEDTLVTSEELQRHIEDEDDKFKVLFDSHQRLLNEVTSIGKAVARIEGKLDQ